MEDQPRARRFALLAIAVLVGFGALAALVRAEEVWLTFGAFVAFVVLGARAVSLWHWDEIVFEADAPAGAGSTPGKPVAVRALKATPKVSGRPRIPKTKE